MALIDVSSIIQLAYFGSFIVLMFYGQRIQVSMMLVGVKRNLGKLERLRKAAHDSVLSSALRFKGDQKAVESRIDRLTGSFAIQPVSMDPSGIVGKLEHILDTYDDNLRTEVKAIALAQRMPRLTHSPTRWKSPSARIRCTEWSATSTS